VSKFRGQRLDPRPEPQHPWGSDGWRDQRVGRIRETYPGHAPAMELAQLLADAVENELSVVTVAALAQAIPDLKWWQLVHILPELDR